MKTPYRSKQSAEYLHAKRRALERYGVRLDKDSYLKLCRAIQEGNGTFLGRQSHRLTVWRLNVPNGDGCVQIPVVYDKLRKRIVTCLPPEANSAWGVDLKEYEAYIDDGQGTD
jgi:hypothetical protein